MLTVREYRAKKAVSCVQINPRCSSREIRSKFASCEPFSDCKPGTFRVSLVFRVEFNERNCGATLLIEKNGASLPIAS